MRSNRPYVQIDPDVLERARQVDLLSYLQVYEPSNLVKVKSITNVYCTVEHDSLKISNGKWYWWVRGFGGYSAFDLLFYATYLKCEGRITKRKTCSPCRACISPRKR